jgi:transposase
VLVVSNAHKRVKGRKRHILVDTIGLPVANRVEPANTSDRRAGALLLGGLSALFPRIRTVIADAGHESRKFARTLKQNQGWQLRIVKRRQRAFKITGLTWIVERSFAWLGRNRRPSKDYEYWMQTSETMIDLVPPYAQPNRPCMRLFKHPLRIDQASGRWNFRLMVSVERNLASREDTLSIFSGPIATIRALGRQIFLVVR